MAQPNNQPLMDPLIHEFHENEILLADKLYAKAYEHFELCVIANGLYSFLKACVAPFFIALSEPRRQLETIWLILIIPLSIMQAIYYWRVKIFAKDKAIFLRVADQVRHAAYFMPGQVSWSAMQSRTHDDVINFRNPAATQVNDKEVKILSLQIKYDLLQHDTLIKISGRMLFIIYTGLHIWGFIVFVNSNQNPSPADYLIIVILFLGTYQYLQIYLFLVGIIVAIPFFLIYLAVNEIRKRRKKSRIVQKLKGQKYNPVKLKGDHLCQICMDEYKEPDIITVLPCNQMHHFHKNCLTEWIKVSGTCPLCRVDVENS